MGLVRNATHPEDVRLKKLEKVQLEISAEKRTIYEQREKRREEAGKQKREEEASKRRREPQRSGYPVRPRYFSFRPT